MRAIHGLALSALLSASGAAMAGQGKGPAEKETQPRTDRHGDPLPPGAVARLGTVRLRHPEVRSLVYSPDGKILASAGGSTVRLWDPKTGKERRRLGAGSSALVRSATFSPDGKLLATADTEGGGTVRLWEPATGKEVRTLRAQRIGEGGLAFSPDGRVLFAGAGTTVHRWRMPAGEALPAFTGLAGAEVIVISRDGKLMATAWQGPRFELRNPATGELLRHLGDRDAGHSHSSSLAFLPDGKTLASASGYNRAPRLWDTATGKELRPLGPYGSCVAAAPDGKSVAVGCRDQVRRWDLTTGKELPRLRGHGFGVVSVAYAPDGKSLAVASYGVIHVWDLARGKRLFPSAEGSAPLRCVAASPDGRTIATVSWAGAPQLLDRSGRPLRPLALPRTGVATVAFAPDGKTLATGSHDKLVRLWEMATGKLLREFRGHGASV